MLAATILLACASSASCEMPSPWKSFPPISVQGREARTWMRAYRLNDIGLPAQIVSSQGNLLASPVTLDMVADGRPIVWSKASGHWTRVGPTCARYSYQASSADLRLKLDGLVEPDGMWRLDLVLIPSRPVSLDRLCLVIPISPQHAGLMHWYPLPRNWPNVTFFDRAFQNAGARPTKWESPFTPFVWIGDEERGLEWFCESDETWRPRSANSALTVRESDGQVRFTAHIIERSSELTEPYHLTFGLQAGPVKPRSPLLVQGDVGYSHWGVYGMESGIRAGTGMTQLEYVKSLGMKFVGMHEDWTDFQGMPRVTRPKEMRSLADAVHQKDMGLVLYHSMALPDIAPEFDRLADECLCEPRTANYVHSRQPEQRDYPVCHRSPYPAVWADGIEALFEEFGIDGLYLDGASCPIPCANARHGCGYTDDAGQAHPTYPIFAARATMKRLRTICESQNKPTLMVAHMSSMIALPSLSFADILLTGEQYWKSPEDYRPPIEFFRTECMGHNHGIPTHFIGYPPLNGEYARTMIGLHNAPSPWCIGGVEMWRVYKEFDVDAAKWTPYWAAKPLASANTDRLLISGFVHPNGRALIAVGNLAMNQRKVELALSPDLSRFTSAKDPITGTKLRIRSGRIALDLGPEGLQWIWLD
jgi:hypothetical protein